MATSSIIMHMRAHAGAYAEIMKRGFYYKLFKPQATLRVRSTFITVQAINDWNSLPNHVAHSMILKIFSTVAGLLYCMIIN